MKLFLVVIIFTSIVFNGCKKDKDDSSNNNNTTTYTINGKLFNRETNEAISNAYITFDDRSYTTTANDGSFETEITKGSRLISVFAENYIVFSGLVEINADTEFNIALDYKPDAGKSGVVTGTVNSTNTDRVTIHSEGFFVNADGNGSYSLRLPEGTRKIHATDENGVSDAFDITISNNDVSNIDLAISDNDLCSRGSHLEQGGSLVRCDVDYLPYSIIRKDHNTFVIENFDCDLDNYIDKVEYSFSDGTPSQTIYANSGTIQNWDGYSVGYFICECQPIGIVSVTATIYFIDGSEKTEQSTPQDYGTEFTYCNYGGGNGDSGSITISGNSSFDGTLQIKSALSWDDPDPTWYITFWDISYQDFINNTAFPNSKVELIFHEDPYAPGTHPIKECILQIFNPDIVIEAEEYSGSMTVGNTGNIYTISFSGSFDSGNGGGNYNANYTGEIHDYN